nr:hypothetical protein [Tanacetum cinerariifolium]
MVDKQIQEDRGHQLAIINLVYQYGDATEAKDELLKAYEQCRDISMDKRAMINKFLKIESELEYEIQSALFKKATKLEKQIRDKLEVDGGNVSSCTLLFTIPYPTWHSLKLLGFSKDKDQVRGVLLLPNFLSFMYTLLKSQQKRELWGYIRSMIDRWEGETVILGDFNKVQIEQERFGFVFNAQGDNVFNNSYSMTNLIDLPLGGYSYTWAQKTATKMSKLDRFLISKDYGPTPFRMFHSWFKMEGFDKLLEKSWKSMNLIESNAMICLKKKFQLLKYTIKNWSKENKAKLNATKADVQKSYRRWIKFLIKTKVWECGNNKSRGPDGFSFEFIRMFWSLIDNDVVAVVSESFACGKFHPRLKKAQEKDKIGSKPDKHRKRGEAKKCQKQLQ